MLERVFSYLISKFEKANISWAQEGEDLILARFFEQKKNGFYIDVGAHHPKRFSNTQYFYLRGWRGINIDANIDSIKLFSKYRPKDKNICIGIGPSNSSMKYYKFQESALNTFSSSRYESLKDTWRIKDIINIPISPLSEVLKQNMPKQQHIDFMNIDVEGLDYEVLLSNDWNKYRPDYLLIEILNKNMDTINLNKEVLYLKKIGYSIKAMTCNTVILGLYT